MSSRIEELEAQLKKYPEEDVLDGNSAAAHIAYACSDTAFIYPITPSSAMAEIYEVWSHQGRLNVFGQNCTVKQLQSEAGAAGAVHGALSVGSMTVTFTASQGLLLMIPPMYKIAGELIPAVFHVSARAIAGQALSIFGDHSDVMAIRQCGWAMLSSASVQECMDMAMIAHMATLKAKVPFVHFFDGFRTSHELQKIQVLNYLTVRNLLDHEKVQEFRSRALNPTHPYLKGTAQGPEVYFQNVEAANKFYDRVPDIVEECMAEFGKVVGRHYTLFEYFGDPEATSMIVVMGAGGPVCQEAVTYMQKRGDKVGVLTVHLFRPWRLNRFLEQIPKTVTRICVLDRTKESGSLGEPLFLDVAASIQSDPTRAGCTKIIGGRYGLGSKDFIPAMVLACFANLESDSPTRGFTVGIIDDVTHLSLPWEKFKVDAVPEGTTECMFWGMGSDGTVGANKNVIKILGNSTPLQVQGYFAYSAHKAGGLTVSHLRFGPKKITSQYLLQTANYIAVHRGQYITQYNVLEPMKQGGTFVLNTNWTDEDVEEQIPGSVKRQIAQKDVKFYTIDANKVAAACGMGRRVNNILMTVFFRLSGVLPFEQAIHLFKSAIQKTYGKKGMHVVEANWKSVDAAIENIHEIKYDKEKWLAAPQTALERRLPRQRKLESPPEFVSNVMLALERMEGDLLPISALAPFTGGILPLCTASYEKRGIALNVPIVDMDKCIQCNQCAFVCPHAAIRPFLIDDDEAEKAPNTFNMKKFKGPAALAGFQYRIQVSPLDCTGCELCSLACPAECLKMTALDEVKDVQNKNWDFAMGLAERSELLSDEERITLKGSQMFTPMLEFSGACEGCGETPYVKLLTQLFGERLIIANATGCSSIWGASYPSNPYTINEKGYGPAWGNSLFEDNAEYGFGMAIATAHRRRRLVETVGGALADEGCKALMSAELVELLTEWHANYLKAGICQRVFEKAKPLLVVEKSKHEFIQRVYNECDLLPRISQWIIGGDGWAYDIGFGGVDHVVASGVDLNILILDTEVYSNTGGQASKSTTLGAVHKFATGGRLRNKKDLGAMVMEYGDVYVASVSSSANMTQTIRAFVEAEEYCGTSVIIAYSPCIEHGYIKPFSLQIEHCKLAVESGYWPLYRYNPALLDKGENPFQLDSRKLKSEIVELLKKENRFGTLRRQDPALAAELEVKLQKWASDRFERLLIKAEGATRAAKQEQGDVVNILYGSETGNAEDLSKRLARLMKERGIPVKVTQLDELSVDDVSSMTSVIIVCSTCGQGEFPGNAKEFYESLASAEYDGQVMLFKNMKYAVFGLGDTAYVFFNECAKLLDKRFAELGATRLLEYGKGDDQAPEKFETAFAEWLPEYFTAINAPEPKNVSHEPSASMFKIEKVSPAKYTMCSHYGSVKLELTVNKRISAADHDVDIRHMEFDLTGTNFRYALGDSLAIFPQNEPGMVKKFCEYAGFDPSQWIRITPSGSETSGKHMALFKHPMTVQQLFEECLDIFGRPSRSFYEELYKYCTDPAEKESAKNLLDKSNKEMMSTWTTKDTVTCFDVAKKFKSCKFTIEQLIDLIPVLKPRYYSIASSQKYVGANSLHLCVGVVNWQDSAGTERFGECTGYIKRTVPSESNKVFFNCALKATAFNLPPTDKHPIIVCGMGTGLAPFRAFIQYRAFLKNSGKEIGPLVLYFGCRYSKKDYLYGEELEKFKADGVISDLKVAFSRDQKEKIYIQHLMVGDPEMLYKRLVEQDGYFYLCGSAKQVPIDVRKAVRTVLCGKEGIGDDVAEERITNWQIKGKYNVEAW